MQKAYKTLTFLKHLLPAIIWGVGVLIVLSIPSDSIPESKLLNIEHIDKGVHFVLFFVFSLLLCFGFFKQQIIGALNKNYVIYAFLISVLYGGLTEFLQFAWFESRSGNIFDFFANTVGAIAGVLGFYLFVKNAQYK